MQADSVETCSREDSIDLDPDFCIDRIISRHGMKQVNPSLYSAKTSRSTFGDIRSALIPRARQLPTIKEPEPRSEDVRCAKPHISYKAAARSEETSTQDSPTERPARRQNLLARRGLMSLTVNKLHPRKRTECMSVERDTFTINQHGRNRAPDLNKMPDSLLAKDVRSGRSTVQESVKTAIVNVYAEARIQLNLPVYHRRLRKQAYPPRVHYSELSELTNTVHEVTKRTCTRVVSPQSPHMRSFSEVHTLSCSPSCASDGSRPRSLR